MKYKKEKFCINCKFYIPSTDIKEWKTNCGTCNSGYITDFYEASENQTTKNMVRIESDDVFDAYVGPQFGCVHWEIKNEK